MSEGSYCRYNFRFLRRRSSGFALAEVLPELTDEVPSPEASVASAPAEEASTPEAPLAAPLKPLQANDADCICGAIGAKDGARMLGAAVIPANRISAGTAPAPDLRPFIDALDPAGPQSAISENGQRLGEKRQGRGGNRRCTCSHAFRNRRP